MTHDDEAVRSLAKFLTGWLADRPGWARVPGGRFSAWRTPEDLAADLVTDAMFRRLTFAKWLKSPDSEVVLEAVRLVLPWPYDLEYELLVQAVQLALESRQRGRRRDAVILAVALVGLALVSLSAGEA